MFVLTDVLSASIVSVTVIVVVVFSSFYHWTHCNIEHDIVLQIILSLLYDIT